MATEVKTLINLRKVQKKKYGPESSGLVPKVVEFGMILAKDKQGESHLYGYCVMNRYKTTLQDYLQNQDTIDPLDVLDIGV